jgi:hypothetical protein
MEEDQERHLEPAPCEPECTEEDLEQATEWVRTCMFEGM